MRIPALALFLNLVLVGAVAASPITPFVGDFVGVGVTNDPSDLEVPLSVRNLDVSISEAGDGFTVSWVTLIHRGADAKPRFDFKSAELTFEPTDRPLVFEAEGQQSRDVDEGIAWARVQGNMLVVYQLSIGTEGLFELASYRRTLTETGMSLVFIYSREGSPVRTVSGQLRRAGQQ